MARIAMAAAMIAAVSSLLAEPADAARGRVPRPIVPNTVLPKASLPKASLMAQGAPAIMPAAMERFCDEYPEECRPTSGTPVAVLSPAQWAELQAINQAVNVAIKPGSDGHGDVWSLGTRSGDCDDYAVQKRHDLIARGWPAGAVSLAVARIPNGEHHLVVVVRTHRGDFVLDSLTDRIRAWDRTGYRWAMRSSADDPKVWHAIGPATDPLVPTGAVR
ncbi:MAG: transglutaminase-like cysteine peptidase [Methylacidiphilales bacterium]|nr:transglutaminase-like cysteine peptidase [Candidatus Methylacidiphilales bacterium]